jgi:hypothetical protein
MDLVYSQRFKKVPSTCDPFQIRHNLHRLNLAHTHVNISGFTVCPAALFSSKFVLTDRTTLSRVYENGGRRGISRRARAFRETILLYSGTQ